MTRLFFSTGMLMLLVAVNACLPDSGSAAKDPEPATRTETFAAKKGLELINKCIAAHGGIDRWNQFDGLSCNIEISGKSIYQITQLKDRRSYSRTNDFELGSDGKQIWVTPDADKVPGKSAAYYYNLDFYYIAIPFVLKDPGVNVSYLGKATPDGETYDLLKVSFDSNVGLSDGDLYFLYLDPATHQLRILSYTVSFFDKSNTKVNSAKLFSDYQNVQGIMMPGKLTSYRWRNDKLGEPSNRDRIISDYKFYETIEDESIFEVPPGAVTEPL